MNKIRIHPLFYITLIPVILCGEFKNFSVFLSIILFHELGHITVALYYHFHIDKIILLPFGALTVFKEAINRPLKQEFYVTIAGPLFQILFSIFLYQYNPSYLFYHYALLIFNLLPIVPLDGSKLWNIFFNTIFPFQKSYQLTIYLSIGTLLLAGYQLMNSPSLIHFLILLFLSLRIIKEQKEKKSIYMKFLLERILYQFSFKKTKIIKGLQIEQMKKDYKHLFYIGQTYHTEREILQKMFDKPYKK